MTLPVHPIEVESYRILGERVDLTRWPEASRAVVARVIHAAADISYADTLVVDDDACRAGIAALRAGAPVIADVEMVAVATRRAGSRCLLAEGRILAADHPDLGLTASAAAMRVAAQRWPAGAVVVVGNAPTALVEVVRLAALGAFRPALVIGLPVGFVGAAEAKAALPRFGSSVGEQRRREGRERSGGGRPQRPLAPGRGARPVTAWTIGPVVHLVGAGPGDPMLLTRRAARLLAVADVVVLDRRSLDDIASLAPATAERIYVGRADGRPAWDTDSVADLLAARARTATPAPAAPADAIDRARTHQRGGDPARSAIGRRPVVVRLKSGDPFVCSRAGEEMAALVARGVHVEVTPGVSAATAAPLAAGMVRGRSVTILAGNHDPVHPPTDLAALADPAASLVILVGRARQGSIADSLVAAGLDPATPAAEVHAATRPGVRINRTTLGHLGRHRLPPPATVVIGPVEEVDRAHP